jgi:protein phosphatase
LANRQVWRRAEDSLELLGMGTTVTAVLVDGIKAAFANVGDSRVYLFRDARIEQLSVDDTASMQTFAADGHTAVKRSVLTRAAGSERDVEVHLSEVELASEDLLLLCSDGLHGYVPQEQIASLIGTAGPIAARTEALIAATRAAGAPDNVSAVLLQRRRD